MLDKFQKISVNQFLIKDLFENIQNFKRHLNGKKKVQLNTLILAPNFKTYPKWCLAAANPLNLTLELVNCHDIFKPALAYQPHLKLFFESI